MDRDKDKNRAPRSSPATQTRNGTPNSSQRGLATRAELNAIINSNPGLISNSADARKWLESKSWILAGEDYNHTKMIKILLTASLMPNLPPDAALAIQAVAFIFEDNINDTISTALASAISDKVNVNLLGQLQMT